MEIQNSITLKGLIYMVLGTRHNPFSEFPWPSLLLTYFFVKGNKLLTNHSHEDCKPVSRARQLTTQAGELSDTLHIWLGYSPEQFGSPNQDNSQCDECLVMPIYKI